MGPCPHGRVCDLKVILQVAEAPVTNVTWTTSSMLYSRCRCFLERVVQHLSISGFLVATSQLKMEKYVISARKPWTVQVRNLQVMLSVVPWAFPLSLQSAGWILEEQHFTLCQNLVFIPSHVSTPPSCSSPWTFLRSHPKQVHHGILLTDTAL